METRTKMTITLPDDLHRQAKAVAAMQGATVSAVVRGALEGYVSEALINDAHVRAVLKVEADIAAGKEKLHPWREVKSRLREKRALQIGAKPARGGSRGANTPSSTSVSAEDKAVILASAAALATSNR